MLSLLLKRRVTNLDVRTSDLSQAQMLGLETQMLGLGVQMLGLSSYEEPLLSWYHMHELSRCCVVLHRGCAYELFWVLLSNCCNNVCNWNIWELVGCR